MNKDADCSVAVLIEVLPFDTTQITSDKNWSHPKWGGSCHPLAVGQHPPAVVIKVKQNEDLNVPSINSPEC